MDPTNGSTPPPEEPGTSIVPRPAEEPTLAEIQAGIARLEREKDLRLRAAIAVTRASDWIDYEGKPYPQAPACEAIAAAFRLSLTGIRAEKAVEKDEDGLYYVWTYRGTAAAPEGAPFEMEASVSSRDAFLGTRTREGRPLSQVDEAAIRQKAYTRMMRNAILRRLGIRGFTWEYVEEASQRRILKSKATSVEHEKRGGSSDPLDEVLKFGPAKGKRFGDLTEPEIEKYLAIWKRDLADPEKAKWKARTERQVKAAEALLALRRQTPWDKVVEAGKALGFSEAKIRGVAKATVPDAKKPGDLGPQDAVKVIEALRAEAPPAGEEG